MTAAALIFESAAIIRVRLLNADAHDWASHLVERALLTLVWVGIWFGHLTLVACCASFVTRRVALFSALMMGLVTVHSWIVVAILAQSDINQFEAGPFLAPAALLALQVPHFVMRRFWRWRLGLATEDYPDVSRIRFSLRELLSSFMLFCIALASAQAGLRLGFDVDSPTELGLRYLMRWIWLVTGLLALGATGGAISLSFCWIMLSSAKVNRRAYVFAVVVFSLIVLTSGAITLAAYLDPSVLKDFLFVYGFGLLAAILGGLPFLVLGQLTARILGLRLSPSPQTLKAEDPEVEELAAFLKRELNGG
jgi:hypothetical protein